MPFPGSFFRKWRDRNRSSEQRASYAVFVEKNPKAAACIRENLAFTKLAEDGKLLNMDVLQALRSLEGKGVFDIIFMDPHIIMNWKDRCWNI